LHITHTEDIIEATVESNENTTENISPNNETNENNINNSNNINNGC